MVILTPAQDGGRAVNADALMHHHVRALFTLDRAGRLETVNDAGGAAAPRFFLGRTAEGYRWWFRHDVEEALAEQLASLCRAQPAGIDLDEGGSKPLLGRERLRLLSPHFRLCRRE
jgi:hypothetical protein